MSSTPFFDVRMKGFRERTSVADALRLLDERIAVLPSETVPLLECAGRVLASSISSPVDVPGFTRSAMDGYAVRADETPGSLELIGESLPGRGFAGTVGPGQAVRIMTGAPLPAGADAVLMAELADEREGRVLARESTRPGKHIVRIGEDVTMGSEVLSAGRQLRPQDVGLLASVGIATVTVVCRPRVAILVTGDELLPPGSTPEGVRIVDSNSPMLAAFVARDGGVCLPISYVPDRFETVRDAIHFADADVILVSGGSSVGTEDHAPRAVASLGELAVHGIALRPAGPTGIGFLPSRVAFLLPGNPVSCLCAYDLFAGRAIRHLGGRNREMPYRTFSLPLATAVPSVVGRVDYVRVKVTDGSLEPLASGGASNLSSTVVADGFILIESERASLEAGELVRAFLYDPHFTMEPTGPNLG